MRTVAEFEEIIRRISYKDMVICSRPYNDCLMEVWLKGKTPCTETGKLQNMEGHSTFIFRQWEPNTIIREVYMLCLRWELHELQEFFKVDGKRPYNPHLSLDALMQLN